MTKKIGTEYICVIGKERKRRKDSVCNALQLGAQSRQNGQHLSQEKNQEIYVEFKTDSVSDRCGSSQASTL